MTDPSNVVDILYYLMNTQHIITMALCIHIVWGHLALCMPDVSSAPLHNVETYSAIELNTIISRSELFFSRYATKSPRLHPVYDRMRATLIAGGTIICHPPFLP